jgi:lysozyme
VSLDIMPGLLAQIEEHEGFRDHAYQDSLGHWTIGYGRLIDKRKGGGISREEARTLLLHDLQTVFAGLDAKLPWWRELDAIRRRVLVDMAFNLGVGGLTKFRATLAAVREGCWDEAAKGMLHSRWAGQVGRRARRLAAMMRTGQDVPLASV